MVERKDYERTIRMPIVDPKKDYRSFREIVEKGLDLGYMSITLEGLEVYNGNPVAVVGLFPISYVEERPRFYIVDGSSTVIDLTKTGSYKKRILSYSQNIPAIREIDQILEDKYGIKRDSYSNLWCLLELRETLMAKNYPLSFIWLGKSKNEDNLINAHLYFPTIIPPSYALERIQEGIKLSIAQKN